MKNEKFLIIEIGSHYKIVDNLNRLVEYKSDLIINRTYLTKEILSDFSYLNDSGVTHSDFGFIDWIKTLGLASKYKKIIVSTGAEESHLPLLFFFLIFMFFFGSKSTLCIRNNKNYMKENNLSSRLRFYFLKCIKILAFESKSQQEFMSKYLDYKKSMVVLYDRYPELKEHNNNLNVQLESFKFNGKLRIGLLGTWDAERRDYELLLGVLNRLSLNERSNLDLVALGNVKYSMNQHLIEKFSTMTNFIYMNGYVSEKDFLELGSTCSVLISPLRSTKGYGLQSGSGSIGDAIYLKKLLIIPSFFDKKNEFGQQLLKYETEEDLYKIIFNLNNEEDFKAVVDYSPYVVDTVRENFYKSWRLA